MAASSQAARQSTWSTPDRPWLVSWNRRLRHLYSISIRNLDFSYTDPRHRGRINDDDVLPGALQSPAKQLALREAKLLGHSRSSDDLRPVQELVNGKDDSSSAPLHGALATSPKDKRLRPTKRMRRRSTLDWSSASSQTRQQTLETLSATRLADVFISLHLKGTEQPVYVSEVVEKTMNPSFRRIDFSGADDWIGRQGSLTIKVWVKKSRLRQFDLLLEMSLDLRSLQYIGKDLASFNHPFPQNTVLFQLSDGIYTCFTDVPTSDVLDPFGATDPRPQSPRAAHSASFDALLRLSKLDDSIQDALALRNRLASDLSKLVGLHKDALQDESRINECKDFVKTINYAKATVEKQLKSLRHTRDRRRDTLQKRLLLMTAGRLERSTGLEHIESEQVDLVQAREGLSITSRAILNQRRRISNDLGRIYSFAPVPERALSFSVRNLQLPDSEELEGAPPETVAAALGYATHALQLMAFYLNQALPYPLHPRSSTSSITDPISNLKVASGSTNGFASPYHTQQSTRRSSMSVPNMPPSLMDPSRTFPLFPRNSGPKYRFEYGLFLLNKDIQTLLSNAYGVRVLDIRQTLPNLMYVLACMGAGEGELPARQAGGVRGLLRSTSGLRGSIEDPRRGVRSGTMTNGDKGILVKKEWHTGSEMRASERPTTFKPGTAKGRLGAERISTANTGIGGADWEGILKGDPSSIKKSAALASAHAGKVEQ